jgi:hypothetical protein
MISIWQTGKPFTVVNSGTGVDSPEGLGFNNRATPQNNNGGGAGADRPNQIAQAETSSHPSAGSSIQMPSLRNRSEKLATPSAIRCLAPTSATSTYPSSRSSQSRNR